MSETYSISFDEDFLVHNGILGQRWGHRNGPPYPLNKSAYSMAEKKANGISPKASSPKISGAKFNNKPANTSLKKIVQGEKKKVSLNDIEQGAKSAQNVINSASRLNNSVDKAIPKSKQKKADLSSISDDELRRKVNRLNLEKQYSQLTSKETARGTDYVREALEIAGGFAGLTLAGIEVAKFIKNK